ncbi:unnamed protein product [Bursaphelenchus okinawaensis]|uniref:P-type domain-containing protein n=1 Tax=Bursaphelenchus okinawaensis TaxID=465554 RepID=A0A811JQN0_9BILA|nr:unnamed protein product [Bursaphelenchus okinawaensis]CAG9078561.1 unnamed protein product [Bursaphelenchus okinawaensis]
MRWLILLCLTIPIAYSKLRSSEVVDPLERVDCSPIPGSTIDNCPDYCPYHEAKEQAEANVPACHFPRQSGYFADPYEHNPLTGTNTYKLRINPYSAKNPYGETSEKIRVETAEIGSGLRIKIGDPNAYEPDIELDKSPTIESDEKLVFKLHDDELFTFSVERESNNNTIWDTSIGGLIFGPQFIQIATKIPTTSIYGFGENIHQALKHDFSKYKTWPLFARDQPPKSDVENFMNLYGVHNFYIGIEDDGKAHGVFVLNSNAQEVSTGPAPHLVYRAIGGQFEIFLFPGPSAEDVIKQYQQVIGKPYLPAYWALGFQLCRYGYKSLQDMSDTLDRVLSYNIPIDTIIPDIDYMERYKDFTVGQDKWYRLPNFVKELNKKGMHVTVILDPAIQVDNAIFDNANSKNASFISWPRKDLVQNKINDLYDNTKGTTHMLSVVWPDRHIVFPDFYDDTQKTAEWWQSEIHDFYDRVGFEGLWIDMNEPAAFATNDPNPWYYDNPDHPNIEPLWCPTTGLDAYHDNPPYRTSAAYQFGKDYPLAGNTICMLATANRGKETFYDVKNLYGLKETIATYDALRNATKKRGQVISRSTFASSGHYGGHWLGDNTARWEDLRTSVIGVQEFNIFGIPFVGSDVCGFIGVSNEELCLRWQQLGAFHSFYRNHNDLHQPNQDPSVWPSVAKVTRIANEYRYRHLPYLYALHYKASQNGGTVIRPVAFEFPEDKNTHALSYQFMWGPAVLVIPNVWPGTTTVKGYLPSSVWYTFYGKNYGKQVEKSGVVATFESPKDTSAPAFLRHGVVLPRQAPGMNTQKSRENNLQIVAGLEKIDDLLWKAEGELFWDDGDNDAYLHENKVNGYRLYQHKHYVIFVTATPTVGRVVIVKDKDDTVDQKIPPIEEIEILGYPVEIDFDSIEVNNLKIYVNKTESSYDAGRKLLRIQNSRSPFIHLQSSYSNGWTVYWRNK